MSSAQRKAERFEEARSHLVATLARDLNASVDEVDQVFAEQFAKLTSQARIQQFVVTLAVRNTRMVMQQHQAATRKLAS